MGMMQEIKGGVGLDIDYKTCIDALSQEIGEENAEDLVLGLRTCACCGKLFSRQFLNYTKDCRGVIFRLACHSCYRKAMAKGFDGEYYEAEF